MYPQDGSVDGVSPSPSFPQIERGVLAFWQQDGTFEASIAQRDDAAEWVFYDGPPFANGLPHYGHLLTGYAKDVFPRFQTMRGKQVPRRFGWDTHGLPAELEAERQLGLAGKTDIEAMGIAAFNAAAKEGVLRYTDQWQEYVTRQARWVDFTNDYKTLDLTFMESVLWAFKELYDRGLVYEGYRVLPYCWRDQTPLSNHELRMDDDVYQMRQDPSVTVSFPLEGHRAEALGLTSVHVLAWTTTPWTLPTNLALAAGPTIEYAVVEVAEGGAFAVGTLVLLARDLVPAHARELGYGDGAEAQAAITRTILGADLAGVRYVPLFDTYTARTDVAAAWQVLVADFVSTADGTGLVHLAPAYGEDDQRVCEAAGIPVIVSLDDAGCFLPEVAPVAGMLWSDANQPLIRLLRESGRLLRERSYEHSYPHCWRCRNPLIYRAVTSWYIRVTAFRDRMVELNEDITWVPANVKHGQFGTWLEHARDWSISRNRYFGSPIPIWRSDDPAYPRMDVYGSLAALERDFGYLPRNASGEPDLHRPYIDDLTRPNPDDPTGRSTMRRIPDVFDVWFDSGSMPFAQAHYPFAQHEWFESHHPADYIVEYIGQTRGWFYTMHVLSTALFDRPAFTNVLCHGIVLGSDGQKMSKSRRNYPDVREVFDRDGADAMRWFLLSSAVLRGGNLVVTEEAIREGVRQLLLPLWNTWYFFSLYANTAEPGGYRAQWRTSSTDDLDRYLFAKLHVLVRDVTTDLEAFDATLAAAKLRDFAEVLTNWYVRRSRDRFWRGTEAGTGPADAATAATHRAAFDTLYTVLETLCRLAAPLLPLIGEHVWRGLTGERSVHLTDWPDPTQIPADPDLVAAMDAVREVCSATLALRKQAARRVRLPLARLTVIVEHPESLSRFTDILRDELNVKTVSVEPLTADSARAFGVTKRLTVLARVAGPRLGSRVQEAIAAARNDDWHTDGDGVIAGGIRLGPSEIELVLQAGNSGGDTAIGLLGNGGFVLLDIATTPELEAEGLARDIVRAVQDARKHAGFDVSDRICCDLSGSNAVVAAVAAHRDFIAAETLSREVTAQVADLPDTEGLAKLGNGEKVLVAVVRA